eukprot:365234-Chlamydomonas_euryale.AAC.3
MVGDNARAPASALALLLALVLATGVLDGACQGAVFVDASAAGPKCTQVWGRGVGSLILQRDNPPGLSACTSVWRWGRGDGAESTRACRCEFGGG